MSEVQFERLPYDVEPINYNITFTPNLETFHYDGIEAIDVRVKSATDTIVLNSVDIKITSARYNEVVSEIVYDAPLEKVKFKFPHPLKEGMGTLHITFTGELNDTMKGFYRSKYTDTAGQEKYLAVTQFEPSDARRAFPCWDEPNRKATFEIVLVVDDKLVALSNMPEHKRHRVDGSPTLSRVEYARSPVMSTYLVAMVVGEFDHVESRDADGVAIRVFTPVGKSERGRFALDVACKTLPFYRQYFDTAYPLPKMDLIAIPDFAAGAMENWGLVTYRETYLLVDPQESSAMSRQNVALVVGHECAHMWFGNLVTMEWWTHLWLNEGFATWIEYLCVDHCYPEFDIWTQFTSYDYTSALELDALRSSHPIEVEVHSPDEIDEIFDRISYSKGASVIRMLNDHLGTETFRAGLRLYLKRWQYKNARTEDLWAALEEASGKSVATLMKTWTKQTGYPMVTMDMVHVEGKEGARAIELRQQRFMIDGSLEDAGHETRWSIPVVLCDVDNSDSVVARVVMSPEQGGGPTTVPLPHGHSGLVRANPGAVGLYRTRYPPTLLPTLLEPLSKGALGPRDRLSLVNDLFALARAGHTSTAAVLEVVRGFRGETSYTVWSSLASNLAGVRLLVQEATASGQPDTEMAETWFNAFLKSLAEPVFNKLGWQAEVHDTDNHNDRLLRPLLLALLGRTGHAEVVQEAKRRFHLHSTSVTTADSTDAQQHVIPADIRTAVYATALRTGGEEEMKKLIELHDHTDLQEERIRVLRALGAAPEHLTQSVLGLAMTDKVRKQDRVTVLVSCTGSLHGRRLVWDFFTTHFAELKEQFSGLFLLASLVKGVTEDFCTTQMEAAINQFFEANPAPCHRAVEQSLEHVRTNAALYNRDVESLVKFLRDNYASAHK